jgi:hypothetical protein
MIMGDLGAATSNLDDTQAQIKHSASNCWLCFDLCGITSMEDSIHIENPKARAVAESIWGANPIDEVDRIPIWLDCDTGLSCSTWS